MTASLSRIVVLFLIGLGFFAGSAYTQPTPQDGYIGVVLKSDDRRIGQQFTFANLRTQRPFVTYPSGNGFEVAKVFEDEELVVLIFVADITGSTDTFYLSKERKCFTLIEVGGLEARVEGKEFIPKVTYGDLK